MKKILSLACAIALCACAILFYQTSFADELAKAHIKAKDKAEAKEDVKAEDKVEVEAQVPEEKKSSSVLPEKVPEKERKADQAETAIQPLLESTKRMRYSWASKRMDDAFWGFRIGDVDGDGIKEALLLERKRIKVGRIVGNSFNQTGTCEWPGISQAGKFYLMDLDADGSKEIVVSTVSDGAPSSVILKYDGKGCQVVAKNIHWSLRAVEFPMEILVGQWWSSEDYFSGPIYEVALSGKKAIKGRKLVLPWNVKLYQFSPEPDVDGKPSVILQKGHERLQVRTKLGKRFKKTWQSGERFGGTINYLPAVQRRVMGSKKSNDVYFDVPPAVVWRGVLSSSSLSIRTCRSAVLSGNIRSSAVRRSSSSIAIRRSASSRSSER